MSKFKVGDKVRIKKGTRYYGENVTFNPRDVTGKVTDLVNTPEYKYRVEWPSGATNIYSDSDLELVIEDIMEKKYKLETELDLQQVLQLYVLTGKLSNMTNLYYETKFLCETHIKKDFETQRLSLGEGFCYTRFQNACKDIVMRSNRKVVTVGDKEYYEDELQIALSNIKPINQ